MLFWHCSKLTSLFSKWNIKLLTCCPYIIQMDFKHKWTNLPNLWGFRPRGNAVIQWAEDIFRSSVCVRENKVQDWKFKVFLVEMYLYSPWLLKIWISLPRSICLKSNSALWWSRLKRCKSLNSYTFLYIFFSLYLESTYDLYGYDYGLWLWLWLILLI